MLVLLLKSIETPLPSTLSLDVEHHMQSLSNPIYIIIRFLPSSDPYLDLISGL